MLKSPQKIRITMYTLEPPVGNSTHCTASQLEITGLSGGLVSEAEQCEQVVVRAES